MLDLTHEDELLAFDAPKDLERRLLDLPRTYPAAHRTGERLRLKLTFDRALAQRKLDEARKSKKTIWPEIGFVSDVHPVVDWLVDKVLIRLGGYPPASRASSRRRAACLSRTRLAAHVRL